MAALKVNLIEHISRDNQTVYNIAVGNAELPICHSVGEEVKTCTSASDAAGASAILYAYSNAILLEALEPHISILPPSWTSSDSNANKHEGVRVRPSTPQAQILVQLRPGDQFIINSRRFSLTISEPDPVLFTPAVSEHSTVVDLENDADNANTSLPRQDDGNVDPASASASHPSLPGDEFDLLGSDNVNAAEDRSLHSMESGGRVDQIGLDTNNEISPPIVGQEEQHDMAREEDMQEQNDGPHSHDVSSIASNEGRPEQDSDPVVEKTFCEEDSGQPPIVLPQAEDVDTQTSTIARIDELFHLAGVDSDINNNGSTPGKVTLTTNIEADTKEKDWVEPDTNLAAIAVGSMESGEDLDSLTLASPPARGRPGAVQPSQLKISLKRKLESPEKETSLRLKTPAKRRKTGDTESSMESTIEVRPRSSRRKVMTSSQTSKREIRGVSGLSAEPNLSSPSQRTTPSQETSARHYDGPPPRVLFSSNSTVDEKAHLMGFFTRQGGRQVKAVEDCNILCVGPGELKKTSKLLLAVVSGKDIVRDKWLVESARQRRLLDPMPYSAEDSDREAEWGTKLGDAVARGKAGTRPLADLAIYFTPTLKKELGTGFLELKEVALLAGATAVYAKLPPKGADPLANILILASSHDRDASTLAEAGWTCYSKDVISLSVLQGRLNTESFRLDLQRSPTEVKSDRKRKK